MVRVMDQLSLPFRIALVAVLAVGAVWMVALRPSSGAPATAPLPTAHHGAATPSGPTAPGVRGLGRAVQHARDVAAGRPVGSASPQVAAPARAVPAAKPPTVAKAPSAAPPVAPHPRTASPHARPTLLLFAGQGADDAVAREVVRSFRGPHVRTIIAPLSRLALYSRLVGNLQISSSPTILVIAPDLTAQEIVGLPDRAQVQQALAALRHG